MDPAGFSISCSSSLNWGSVATEEDFQFENLFLEKHSCERMKHCQSEESRHVENKVERSLSAELVEYLCSGEPAETHQFTAVY